MEHFHVQERCAGCTGTGCRGGIPLDAVRFEGRWAWFCVDACPVVASLAPAERDAFLAGLREGLRSVILSDSFWDALENAATPVAPRGRFLAWAEANRAPTGMPSAQFTKMNNGFVCENCGHEVPPAPGGTCRNHCPACLHSKHVDINPGDRLESCGGLLVPMGVDVGGKKGYVIIHKCERCGTVRRNKAAADDSFDAILALSTRHEV